MKTIRIDLPADLEEIELYPLFDWHIGDSMSDAFLIENTLKCIKETPNAYCILGGDLMDTAIASSIGDTYSAHLQPMEQLKLCVKLFDPIKDKILCILPGNHENRVYKSDGIDTTEMMAAQLGLSARYSETTALLFIRFGQETRRTAEGRKMTYTVYATHGSGGGRREGGKINRLADLAQIVDADVYLCGHTHLPAVFREGFYRVSKSNSAVQYVDRLFVNAAAALNYGGYGDKAGFKPASKQSPVIYLDGKRYRATAKI
jgi:predicted phosphodiesterase